MINYNAPRKVNEDEFKEIMELQKKTLKKRIDQILIKQCGLDKNYFSYKSDDGENLLIQKELLFDNCEIIFRKKLAH